MKGMYLLFVVFVWISCNHEDKVKLHIDHPGIFAHYDISAEDGNSIATCLIRYYTDKSQKNTLGPDMLRSVELDGEVIPMDSSRFSGVFYETQLPVSDFYEQHIIAFTGTNGRKYEDKLPFVPMELHTDLSEPVSKAGLVLELEGLESEDEVRLVMIDTAFDSHGINQVEIVRNGQLVIDDQLLRTLKSGPIVLEISKETEASLTSGLDGILTTTYTIRRSVLLQE